MFKYSDAIKAEKRQLTSEQEAIIRKHVGHNDTLNIGYGSSHGETNTFEVWNAETLEFECGFDADENIIF